LISGFVGPAGGTTGFELQVPDLDLDFSNMPRPALTPGEVYTVTGEFHDRWYPLRGRTKVLFVKALVKNALDLPRERLRDSVALRGTVLTNVVRAGGETTGTVLSGAAPEIKLLRAEDSKFVNQEVIASGSFVVETRTELGIRFVFHADKLTDLKHPKPFTPLEAGKAAAGTTDSAEGYSETFSLQEAILDAVSQLPGSDIADWLTQVHVTSIDAEFGGITGRSRLKVSITSPRPPSG
jgi:hypothetical protein